jgi:16S rRNA (guanine527-N7)-methyltransferase
MLDVGSGAGLPGVVLSIVEPRWDVTCVDAVAKKASFIRQVAAELGLPNLRAQHARVEDLPAPSGFDIVTSRAFASLADFVSLTGPLLSPAGCWMAMKGKVPEDEMAGLPDWVEVFHVEQLEVPSLEAQRCLVWMRKRRT